MVIMLPVALGELGTPRLLPGPFPQLAEYGEKHRDHSVVGAAVDAQPGRGQRAATPSSIGDQEPAGQNNHNDHLLARFMTSTSVNPTLTDIPMRYFSDAT